MANPRPGPPGSVTAEDGARYYEVDGEQYWSVTTALKVLGSEGLVWWSAGLAAQAALDDVPRLAISLITPPCNNTHSKCKQGKGDRGHDWRLTCETCPCGACQPCVYEWMRRQHAVHRDERADEGRRVHAWIEEWVVSGGKMPPIHPDIAPYVRAFLAFVAAYGLTPDSWLFTEAVVINREHRYAGQTDGAIRFHADTNPLCADWVARALRIPLSQVAGRHADLLFDAKTKNPLPEGKAPVFFPDVALQLGPYRWAQHLRLKPTGEERPMPSLDGAFALYLYPDMAVPRLVVADEVTQAGFLAALNLYRWTVEHGSASVSERSFPLPSEPGVVKATVRAPGTRTPRKATAAKAGAPLASMPSPAAQRAAAKSSATVASMTRKPADAHPDSPYSDEIPF